MLVEYDPDSEWFATLLTMIASALRTDHPTEYFTALHSPAEVRAHLRRMGMDIARLEEIGTFRLVDTFSAGLGLKSEEKFFEESPKLADQSIEIAKQIKSSSVELRRRFGVSDSPPVYLRYNDEKSVIEFYSARILLRNRTLQRAGMTFIPKGMYSTFLYRSLELIYDGIIDIVLQDSPEGPKNLMRIRSFKMSEHDKGWRQLKIGENFEVTLEKQ